MRAPSPFVQSVIGVDATVAQTATSALRRGLRPAAAGGVVGPDGGFGPLAVTAGADFPVRHGVTGTGVTVAEVIDGAPSQRDLAAFAKQFRLRLAKPEVSVVAIDGGKGFDVLQPDVDFEWMMRRSAGRKVHGL